MNADLLKRTIQVVGTGDWTWAFVVTVDRNPVLRTKTVFQLTPWATPITVWLPRDRDEGGAGELVPLVFQPAPIAFRELSHDSEGTVGTVEVSIVDPTRRAIRYVRGGLGYRGLEVSVDGFNVQSPGLGSAKFARATIRNVIVSREAKKNATITFHAEPANLHDGSLPRHTVQAWRCDHRFAGSRCGFRVTETTPTDLRVCDHTWRACHEHGDYEFSIGAPRLHPDRFGATPGALMQRGLG